MNNYVIISDGSCDLSFDEAKKIGVEIVPFNIEFNNRFYKEGVDISVREFYERMVKETGIFPKTSLPTVHDFFVMFEQYASQNIDIICLCITTKFSGSYNSASTARDMILEEYPNIKITIIDTIVNTVLQGLIVKEAVRLKQNGVDYDTLVEAIESHKSTGRIFFTIKDLTYLQHGGRIGKVSSIIGNLLKISPLITLKDGEIFSSGKAISRMRSLLKVKELLANYLKEVKATSDTYIITIGFGYDLEEAKRFRDLLKKDFSEYEFDINQIGATIACHTGPYPLGVGVLKKLDK